MDENMLHLARSRFRARIDSLRNDVARCFWDIPDRNSPQIALFPALMYCFATVDYFSSLWRGWNKSDPKKDRYQTPRMTDFLVAFLLYPKKEARLAIELWRHKLMHTSEPRRLGSKPPETKVYEWQAGIGLPNHMRLQEAGTPEHSFLPFDCNEFVRDMEEAIFGPCGYFAALRDDPTLQQQYADCFKEFDDYKIDLSGL